MASMRNTAPIHYATTRQLGIFPAALPGMLPFQFRPVVNVVQRAVHAIAVVQPCAEQNRVSVDRLVLDPEYAD